MLSRVIVLIVLAVAARESLAFRPGVVLTNDSNHPRNFVIISELDRDGKTHGILHPVRRGEKGDVITTEEEVNGEVDQRSRILITFDRDALAEAIGNGSLNVVLNVTAQVRDDKGLRQIEVPGYSTVGDPLKPSVASLRSVSSVLSLTVEIGRVSGLYGALVDQLKDPTDAHAIERVRVGVLRLMPRILPVLEKLQNPDNRAVVGIVANASSRDVDAVKEEAKMIVERFADLSKSPGARGSEAEQYSSLVTIRDLLISLKELDVPESEIRADLILFVKDTDILVPLTGAKPGEDIIIQLDNLAGGPEQLRTMKVRIEVKRFGLVREVSDTAFFIRRVGVSEGDIDKTISAGLAEAQATGETVSKSTPAVVNYQPAPGVTLGWTAHARRGGKEFLPNVARALEPGFGVSVIFPRFGSRVSTFTPGGTGGLASATLEESNADIHVGAGLVASLFDNAVQCTYGWNLNVPIKRGYFGLGFSFFRVVKRVGDLVEQGKKD